MSDDGQTKRKRTPVILTPHDSYRLAEELRRAIDERREWSTWRAVAEDLGQRIGRPDLNEHHVFHAADMLGVPRSDVHGRRKAEQQQSLNFDAQVVQRIDSIGQVVLSINALVHKHESRLDWLDRYEDRVVQLEHRVKRLESMVVLETEGGAKFYEAKSR